MKLAGNYEDGAVSVMFGGELLRLLMALGNHPDFSIDAFGHSCIQRSKFKKWISGFSSKLILLRHLIRILLRLKAFVRLFWNQKQTWNKCLNG